MRVYEVDLTAADLKGTQLGEGSTNEQAAITGLSIPPGLSGLLLMEFVADADTTDIGTGVAPVIDSLTTVVDVQRIYDGEAIYATPLTSMAVSLAQANADNGAPYAGNSDGPITSDEFTAALAVAQNQVKSTLGFGLDSSVDIFTVPPILTADATTAEEQEKVVKYREAIEAIAALTDQVASDSSASDTPQEIFEGLTEDLKDGTIDGLNDTTPVASLAALDTPIDTTIASLDPTTLVIPNTTTPITDIKQTLTDEMATTGESVDTTPLAIIEVNPAPPALVAESNDTYAVGGTVSGLNGTIVLQNNSGDNLTLSANGSFTFATPVADGNAYNVTVLTRPAGQTCSASANSGTVSGSNVTAIVVTCSTNTYTVGGNIGGLSGSVVLQNNGGDDLTVNADGTFTFGTPIAYGNTYDVSVLTQPAGQTCTASTNSGTVSSANITNVAITCTTNTYTIGGSVSGLTGSAVLQNNGGDDLTINADGTFTFGTPIAYGTPYSVAVLSQPAGQTCTASTNNGTVGSANITNVAITCTTNTYTIGGSVSGLTGSVVLQNNGGDDLTVNVDGTFTFGTPIAYGNSYDVSVLMSPVGQTCVASSNTGSVSGANVTNVAISCTTHTYTIGGTVTGLSGSVVLQNNGGDDLTVNADGTFTFGTPVAYGNSYAVSVLTQPAGQTCTASTNSGTVGSANIANVAINCTTNSYTIGGTVTGLTGSVVLQNNGGDDLTLNTNSSFAFSTSVVHGGTYSVSVLVQPSGQTCTVSNDIGTVNAADVTDVSLYCATDPVIVAEAKPGSVTVSWSDTGAPSYDLYYSTAPDCDIANYAGCAGGAMVPNVSSPYTVSSLTNGRNYWFKLESVAGGGNALSNEAGAQPYQIVTNNQVRAIANDANGVTYLGGDFTLVGRGTGGGVPLGATTGVPAAFPQVYGIVRAAISDGAGGYYIGGLFSSVDGQPRSNLAHILADGSLGSWSPATDNYVLALAISGSTVYAGGSFTTIDDGNGVQTRNRLAAIGTDGALSATWNPDAGGEVDAIAVSGGMVYVGGTFTSIGGQTRNRLAAIGTDGTLSDTWDPDAGGTVNAIAVSGGTVYVGGAFTSISGQTRNRLAAIDTGGAYLGWDPNAGGSVYALAVSGSSVYVGGTFTTVGGLTRNRLAAIGTDGVLSSSWIPDVSGSTVRTLAVSGSTVYVGGYFTTIDDGSGAQPRANLAAIGTDGTLTNWDPTPDGFVTTLATSGSTVYVGGSFYLLDGVQRNRLAAINSDGTLSSWNPDANATVYTFAVSGTTVYAGGRFSTIGGTLRAHLAAIDTSGTLTNWDPGTDFGVFAIAVSNNTVYVGGEFSNVSGTPRSYLAAIGTDGTLSNTWIPSADAPVNAIAVSNDMIYVGGYFSTIDSQDRRYIAAIDSGGTLSSWDPALQSSVYALAVSGSTVYVGGDFTTAVPASVFGRSSVIRRHLAAFGTDGTVSDWNPDADETVYALAVSGNTVYIGGYFETVGGQARKLIAAVGTDGTLSSWNANGNTAMFQYVSAISVSNNTIYAGGLFVGIGGKTDSYFTALEP